MSNIFRSPILFKFFFLIAVLGASLSYADFMMTYLVQIHAIDYIIKEEKDKALAVTSKDQIGTVISAMDEIDKNIQKMEDLYEKIKNADEKDRKEGFSADYYYNEAKNKKDVEAKIKASKEALEKVRAHYNKITKKSAGSAGEAVQGLSPADRADMEPVKPEPKDEH